MRQNGKKISIGRPTFHFFFLCTELRLHLQRANVIRKPLIAEERIAITLWRLGTDTEYRSIAHLFGVGLSTVCVTLHEVCTAIVEFLSQRYICIPTGENAQQIGDGFLHTWGFPQCFGAIDGSHISIITLKDNPIDFYNRKKFHSIVLLTQHFNEFCISLQLTFCFLLLPSPPFQFQFFLSLGKYLLFL